MIAKIGARTYDIVFMDQDPVLDEHPDAKAYTDHDESRIVIRFGLSSDAQGDLLVHELLHAIVRNAGLDEKLGEDEIRALAPRFHDFLLNNHEIIDHILKLH